jgi:lipopolysaccharide transport system ATP-binding protein
MNTTAIYLSGVSKNYLLYDRNILDRFKDVFLPGKRTFHKDFEALKDISVSVKKGDIVGVVGRNGAGKSTLLRIISGVTGATTGEVHVNGRIVPLLELGGGLNQEYTGRENIYFSCALQGMHKREIDALYPEIVEFSELKDFIDVPVKRYSSGMKARLSFAVSININPDILILDEVLGVGDEMFKKKCFTRMQEFFTSGKTIVYVSHSLGSVKQLCSKALLLHKGEMLLQSHPELVINAYQQLLSVQDKSDDEEKAIEEIKRLENDDKLKGEREARVRNRNLRKRITETGESVTDGTTAFYVENFESTERRSVQTKQIDIREGSLTTVSGKPVNHLVWGERYVLRFRADFREAAENVRLGFILYDERNTDISGLVSPDRYNPILFVPAGESRTVEAAFSAYLSAGLYAVRFVVRAKHGEREQPVSFLTDAIVFRCMGLPKDISTVQLFHGCSII